MSDSISFFSLSNPAYFLFHLQNFFHWYILQSWKLKRPQIQFRPHHFWTYTSNLTSGQLSTKIYDKRDDFNFKIINFPNMCSNIPASPAYDVYISQLIRYARASSDYSNFLKRHLHLRNRLLDQGYKKIRLIRSLKMYKDKEVNKNTKKYCFINVWRKSVFDIYFTECGTALTTISPMLFH